VARSEVSGGLKEDNFQKKIQKQQKSYKFNRKCKGMRTDLPVNSRQAPYSMHYTIQRKFKSSEKFLLNVFLSVNVDGAWPAPLQ
jgi:hypothetical protein